MFPLELGADGCDESCDGVTLHKDTTVFCRAFQEAVADKPSSAKIYLVNDQVARSYALRREKRANNGSNIAACNIKPVPNLRTAHERKISLP